MIQEMFVLYTKVRIDFCSKMQKYLLYSILQLMLLRLMLSAAYSNHILVSSLVYCTGRLEISDNY